MKLSIIIPIYNEAPTVEEVMARIVRARLPAGLAREVIVVDDGSNDATRSALNALGQQYDFTLIHLVPNQGKGQALREGIGASSGDIILFQDCDLEYNPEDYQALVTPILEGRAEVVYGSRFGDAAHKPEISKLFRAGNRFLTAFSNLCSGLRLTDMETGYKVFKAPVLRGTRLVESGFGIEPEITAKMACLVKHEGVRILEVPVSYHARNYAEGKKIKPIHGLEAIWCIAKYNFWAKDTKRSAAAETPVTRP